MAGHLPAYFSSDTPEERTDCSYFRKRLKNILTAVVLCLLICGLPGTSAQGPSPARLGGTYIQLLNHHLEWNEEDWQRLFDDFRTLDITGIVVQWSVSSDLAFYPSETFTHEGKNPLEFILRLADETGIAVQLGLWHDPDYWNNIKAPAELLEFYLGHARYRCTTIAKELALPAQRHPSFQGWYITEEIDDTSWNEPLRRKILMDHLAILTRDLREITPEASVGISAFSNARLDPESFRKFWKEILAEASIDILYFQDGIGTNKLDLSYLSFYLDAANLAARAENCSLAIVVELFEQKPVPYGSEEAFQAFPAALSRIERQMRLAASFVGDRTMAFSIPDYMQSAGSDDSRRLYQAYVMKFIAPEEPVVID